VDIEMGPKKSARIQLNQNTGWLSQQNDGSSFTGRATISFQRRKQQHGASFNEECAAGEHLFIKCDAYRSGCDSDSSFGAHECITDVDGTFTVS
jgi:hypothetical protein